MGSAANSKNDLHSLDLNRWKLRDVERARVNLRGIADKVPEPELIGSLVSQLSEILPDVGDPDRVLNNLDHFINSSRSPLATLALFDRDPTALMVLAKIFANSQYLSDILIRDQESFDALRLTEGQPVSREALIDTLRREVAEIDDFEKIGLALRRFKQRQTLRIAFGDLIAGQEVAAVTRQISFLADAICQVSIEFVYRKLERKFGPPLASDGRSCPFTIFALGKLGGNELNYSSDIDLIFVYQDDGHTAGRRRTNRQFFDRLAQDFTRLLTEGSALGTAYRVDWRLRPEGRQGPMTSQFDAFLKYYEDKGRSWERQAMVKARPIAGDLDFGQRILDQLQTWIYLAGWSRGSIESMMALRRKIERKTQLEGEAARNVKSGYGGIRDIEFTIQFLQLLNGSTKSVRTNNTLEAIDRLEAAGCLNMQEYSILHKNYCWLRTVEHRLQIMYDWQTHTLPDSAEELQKIAIRLGYEDDRHQTALQKFESDWQQTKDLNRGILQHLLSTAFGEEEQKEIPEEVDLIFDPDPDPDWARAILRRYRFAEPDRALENLNALARENIRFLSSRRCRHFLAAITPDLLKEIKSTPDPDQTLVHLCTVSESLGGKGMLWELFRIHNPSMKLYVKLCAACDYLTEILTRDPGIFDSLVDSLTLGELPSFGFLQQSIEILTRNAEDLAPIIHAFKNDQHLRVGVRDIVGKDSIRDSHLALSNIAEVIIHCVAERCLREMVQKYGEPHVGQDPCELVILALGKLGGQQPNYHSDLDVVFLYQGQGQTSGPNATSNQHFFSELSQKIIQMISSSGPFGKIYEIDCRLRPTGKSGSLATSFDEFSRYFRSGDARSWERLAMCKARPIFGSRIPRIQAAHLAANAIRSQPWTHQTLLELREMRLRMQENCSSRNLKRAEGGTVDVEFIIQMLQLKHGRIAPEVLQSGMLQAAERLRRGGFLAPRDFDTLSESYSFLRKVESRLRLMNASSRHEFPADAGQQAKLAYLLGEPDVDRLARQVAAYRMKNRELFNRFFDSESA